jgi:bud site selection protein 20
VPTWVAGMGRCPNHKNSHGKHYSHKTARRAKFLVKGDDLIHTELRKVDVPRTQEPNSDLPGLGQFYCLHCDRYFNNASVRDDHYKTKKHKKRVKMMDGAAPHNQIDAEVAAGMDRPDNGPRLQVADPAMTL